MNTSFWTNTVWYLLLFLSSIITLVIILHKSSNKKFAFAFFFSIIGFSFVLEAILVLRLNAYSYYPKIFRDSYLDIIFGNYFSQISLSATSLLLAVYDASSIWYLISSSIYFLVEELFIKLGIYEHFWYKSIYTFIGFIPFSFIAKKWYEKARKQSNRFINYVSLYFSVASFSTFTIFLIQRLFGIQLLHSNIFFTDINRNNTSSGFVYQFIVLNFLIVLYKSKFNRMVKILAFLFLFSAQYIAYKTGFIFITKGLFLTVTSIDLFGCLILIIVFNHFLSKPI